MSQKFAWAFGLEEDDDSFRGCTSRDEAIIEGRIHAEDHDQKYFYIARAVSPDVTTLVSNAIDPDWIIERIIESNLEEMPEGHEEKWFAIPTSAQLTDLEIQVSAVVERWIKKFHPPTWFNLAEHQRVEIGV